MKHKESARRLIEAMANKNIKAVELAALSGVSKASISQYTNGTHIPSNKASKVLGDVLGVNPLWLMDMDEEKYKIARDHMYCDDTEKYIIETYRSADDDAKRKFIEMVNILLRK